MKEIPLTRGYVALVDDEDHAELSQYAWQATNVSPSHMYAMGRHKDEHGIYRTRYMHRVVLGAKKGEYVDHQDGDGLNNQRSNIRICTQAENISNRKGRPSDNTTGYTGVYARAHNRWQAMIGHKRKIIHIGYFACPIEAAKARDEKARELHGEYAYLNFPETRETMI